MSKFAIKVHMVDGNETLRFATLNQVARFLAGRDLGCDYRRFGYLQAECGTYSFVGFNWSDLLTGPAGMSSSKYKPDLLRESVRLRWRGLKLAGRAFANMTAAYDGPEWVGVVTTRTREDGGVATEWFEPSVMTGVDRYGPNCDTLAAAKGWVAARYAAKVAKLVEKNSPVAVAVADDREYD